MEEFGCDEHIISPSSSYRLHVLRKLRVETHGHAMGFSTSAGMCGLTMANAESPRPASAACGCRCRQRPTTGFMFSATLC